jgi:dienelactone hydrolase
VRRVAWKNRYGALIRGDVFAPLRRGRYPGVVITPGSVQGSERMYWWLAEDLAERGYVVLVYDVQGQGTSETFPHQGPVNDLPFCNPFAPRGDLEQFGCPGVPSQQGANFVYGTRNAITFLRSRRNPFHRLLDRSKDRRSVTPGRRTRVAIIGHSLGAFAVSYVQGVDKRVEAAVALDKLASSAQMGVPKPRPVVPALAIQSEYGFTVAPYYLNNGSSLTPSPGPPSSGPDPRRESSTGFDAWRRAGVDTQLIVPRASTHLEYTDIAYALPASRYGQDVASYYVQAWLDKYMKHRRGASARLRARAFTYREPVGNGVWSSVRLRRADRLSFYYCSGLAWRRGASGSSPSSRGRVLVRRDIARVGGC